MDKKAKIYIAGHTGMLGSAIMRYLKSEGYINIVGRTSKELNLLQLTDVQQFFEEEKPEYVFLCAAKVGGIKANMSYPATFLFDNLVIQNNIIHTSYLQGVKKIAFMGSSCIYPRECPQPMKEDYLLSGKLEPTNEGYAIAKIAGLKLIEYYHRQYNMQGIAPMPCNLYGTNDSFDLNHAHVLSSLVRRFVDAKDDNIERVAVWGSGRARREFMHVDDAAKGVVFLMHHWDSPELINIGWGIDYSIKELAELIADKVGYTGRIEWDTSKPEGMPRKCMDTTKIQHLGFMPTISIEQGVEQTIEEYRNLKNNKLL